MDAIAPCMYGVKNVVATLGDSAYGLSRHS